VKDEIESAVCRLEVQVRSRRAQLTQRLAEESQLGDVERTGEEAVLLFSRMSSRTNSTDPSRTKAPSQWPAAGCAAVAAEEARRSDAPPRSVDRGLMTDSFPALGSS
jgi:hypothetical protein